MVYIPESERFPHDPDHHITFASQEEKDINLSEAEEALRIKRMDLERVTTDEERYRAEVAVRQAEEHWKRLNAGVVVAQRPAYKWIPKEEE